MERAPLFRKVRIVGANVLPKNAKTSLFNVGSSLYAEIVIVVCIVFVLTKLVSGNVFLPYYEGFFTYLYSVSIAFFVYVFGYLLLNNKKTTKSELKRHMSQLRNFSMRSVTADNNQELQLMKNSKRTQSPSRQNPVPASSRLGSLKEEIIWFPQTMKENQSSADFTMIEGQILNVTFDRIESPTPRRKKTKVSENEHSHGSFFLRAGAVAFGLGAMIYDGLEFGAFLEIPTDVPCHLALRRINPILHAIFVFMQMYFIFVSARLNIHKFKVVSRFGLMHCLASNVCVWIRTLVSESLKEMQEMQEHYPANEKLVQHKNSTREHRSIVEEHEAVWDPFGNGSCGTNKVLGSVITQAAPFLFPFLIEYSLIGAAVVYVVWSRIGLNPKYCNHGEDAEPGIIEQRQLRIDCLGASKGLFMGILLLAISLLCLVLFFIFAAHPDSQLLSLIIADAAHCTLLFVSLVAMAIGAFQVKDMTFHPEHEEELGALLLRVSAVGIFIYSVFSIIAGLMSPWHNESPVLVLVNGLLSVIQVAVQMLFISDVSRRKIRNEEDNASKPGRQIVTFLLIINIALWLVYTFEMQKVEANPVQLHFYGFIPWAFVQRITLPLCIFYRFHSAIIFAEIWKNTYRFG